VLLQSPSGCYMLQPERNGVFNCLANPGVPKTSFHQRVQKLNRSIVGWSNILGYQHFIQIPEHATSPAAVIGFASQRADWDARWFSPACQE
jgi:hypothetical protein